MPFPPTPSNTATITPTPSNTPSNTPSVTPSGSRCSPQTIYISVCVNPTNDAGGCNYFVVYADYSPNAFGSDPAIVNDDLYIVTTLTDTAFDQTGVYLDLFSGQSRNCQVLCSVGPDGVVISEEINAIIPNSGITANYVISGVSILGDCGSCESCSEILFEQEGIYDVLYEYTDCYGVVQELSLGIDESTTRCGQLSTAIVLSGTGIITYVDTCNPPTPTPTLTNTPTLTPTITSSPTNTPTLTPTASGCQCYYYDVVTYSDDIARASGNTDTFRNGVVYVTYRNCDDSGFTDATFNNEDSPYQNAICVNGLAQYNPPSIFIWQDNVQKTDILSFVVKGGCCT